MPQAIGIVGVIGVGYGVYTNFSKPDDSLTSLTSVQDHFSQALDGAGDRFGQVFKELDKKVCSYTAEALSVLENHGSEIVRKVELAKLGFEKDDIKRIIESSPRQLDEVRAAQRLCP